ncbi:MAG: leucine-rich repeat protein [Oscillospiraceae bacterium]
MKKQITAILTTAMMLCTSIPTVAIPLEISVSAENISSTDFIKAGNLTYRTYEDHAEIVGCSLDTTSVYIPVMIEGLPVTVISEGAFEGCSELTSVLTAEGCKLIHIGANAFAGCGKLEKVTLQGGNTLQSIGERAFADCPSLEFVKIDSDTCDIFDSPDTISAKTIIAHEGSTAQAYGEKYGISVSLTEHSERVTIDGIDYIVSETNAVLFSVNPSMPSEVEIPAYVNGVPVTEIAMGAFQDSYSKNLRKVVIPDTVKSIGERAFADCPYLQDITIPESVEEIGAYAFGRYMGEIPWMRTQQKQNPLVVINGILVNGYMANGAVTIPNTVHTIAPNAFENNTDITSVIIPEGVTKIEAETFSRCENLSFIQIPDTVTEIGNGAFWGVGLQSVILPQSVTTIGTASFIYCKNLQSVTVMNPDCVFDGGTNEVFYNTENLVNKTKVFQGTIYGYSNSTTQTYAETYGRNFIALDSEPLAGDIDGDGAVTASDAAALLIGAAKIGGGQSSGWNVLQEKSADMNGDSLFDSRDAAMIFEYAAYLGAGGTDSPSVYFRSR